MSRFSCSHAALALLALLLAPFPASAEPIEEVMARWEKSLPVNGDALTRRPNAKSVEEVKARAAEAVPVLIARLKSPDLWIRHEAARTLGYLGAAGKDAVPSLIEALHDPFPVPYAVVPAFGDIGPEARTAIPVLLVTARDIPVLRILAADALGGIGEPAREAALGLLDHRAGEMRAVGLRALGGMGEAARPSLPRIRAALAGGTSDERLAAADALVRLDPEGIDADVVAPYVQVSNDDPRHGAHRLNELLQTRQSERVFRALLVLLQRDPRPDAVSTILSLFHRVLPLARAALPTLLDLLRSPSPEVRAAFARFAQYLGPPDAAVQPRLLDLLATGDDLARSTAVGLLAKLGAGAEPAVAVLEPSLTDANPEARRQATVLLVTLANAVPAARERLLPLLLDADEAVASRSAMAIANLNKPTPALLHELLLRFPRSQAKRSLGTAINGMIVRLRKEVEPIVPEILRLLDSPDENLVSWGGSWLLLAAAPLPKGQAYELELIRHAPAEFMGLTVRALVNRGRPGCEALMQELRGHPEPEKAFLELKQNAMPALNVALMSGDRAVLHDAMRLVSALGPIAQSARPVLEQLRDREPTMIEEVEAALKAIDAAEEKK